MPGIDRLRDGPDTVPGMERSESAVAGRDCGVLAEAGARRECALAYCATVEAEYAETGRATGTSRAGDSKAAESAAASRPDMAERYPDQYVRPADSAPRVERPGEHPARWIEARWSVALD